MPARALTLTAGAIGAALLLLLVLGGPAAEARGHTILQSPNLWSTVDVCNSALRPHTLGVRGSMPGSGRSNERMFMRFRAEFLSPNDHHWHYVTRNADSGFREVGQATYKVRQSGWDFQFAPASAPFTLRGVVSFEWRRGTTVVRRTSRATTAGHASPVGSDPRGYSAATCLMH